MPIRKLSNRMKNLQIHNLSNEELTPKELYLLGLGLKYIPKPIDTTNDEFLSAFQEWKRRIIVKNYFEKRPNLSKDQEVYDKDLHVNTNWIPDFTPLQLDKFFKETLEKLKFYLDQNPRNNKFSKLFKTVKTILQKKNLIIKPSDKNLGICLVTKEWYFNECMRQLNSPHYKVQNFDSLLLWNNLKSILSNKYFASNTRIKDFIKYYADNAKLPSFYITIKVHKSPIVGRPIVASNSWFTTGLSTWLGKKLNKLNQADTDYILTDSKTLVKYFSDFKFNPEIKLVTFDVENLYPNIPHQLAYSTLESYLTRLNHPLKDILLRSLKFVLENNFFEFNNVTYKQLLGIAMGTNAAVAIANITLLELEKNFFLSSIYEDSNYEHQITKGNLFYKRYIDDGLIIYNLHENIDNFKTKFEQAMKPFKFTWKISNYEIEYLDLHIYKGELFNSKRKLDISVHQKTLNKYLYLPYHSFHNPLMKKAFIQTELQRYVRNSSSLELFLDISKKFYTRLRNRGYPAEFLRKTFAIVRYEKRRGYLDKFTSDNLIISDQENDQEDEVSTFFVIPYTERSWNLRIHHLLNKEITANPGLKIPKVNASWKKTKNLQQLLTRAHFEKLND